MAISTCKVRLSYLFINPPKKDDNGNDVYSVALIIPKTENGKKFKDIFDAEVKNIAASDRAVKEWGPKTQLKNVHIPWKDGDDDNEVSAGQWVLNAKNKSLPSLWAKDRTPGDIEDFYSGCYAQAVISLYPYNYNGRKGIGIWLEGLRKLAEGEKLSGVTVNANSFDDDLIEDSDLEDDIFD